ncbi:MAG: dihydroorotase family protein [Acidimicrobiales bacterium]
MTEPRYDTVITGAEVVLGEAGRQRRTVAIRDGRVAALLAPEEPASAHRVIDARDKVVIPGVIDPHTHIGYEGYRGIPLDAMPSHFETETESALVGGVTTLLCTYRNASPYHEIWEEMLKAGEENSRIDFAYSLGITNDAQLARIADYYRDFGVSSFKLYMAYRGEEAKATGNAYNTYDDGLLYESMEAVAEIPGGIVMVHPENIEIIVRLQRRLRELGRDDLAAWSDSRPGFTEAENIRRALFLGEQAGCDVYIPHLSAAISLRAVLEHRARGTNHAYVETCPHYLTHAKDSDVGFLGKVNPPLREAADTRELWAAIASGHVDTVGTDHCGVRREVKGPDIWTAVPGFAGMATLLPVLLTKVSRGELSLERVVEVTSYNTARIFNLYPAKGTLLPGSDADLAVVDLDWSRTVTPALLRSRSDFSIYDGVELTGWPVLTMVRGRVAMQDAQTLAEPGWGEYRPRYGRAREEAME